MRRNIRNLVTGVLLALILTCPALAETQSPTTSGGFRIDVDTNKDVYYDKDVFILTVKLLNNSPFSLLITDEKRLPDGSNEKLVDSPLLEGFLDGSDVDVAFMPPRSQVIIGYATLTPLDSISNPYEYDTQISRPTQISLPLFGQYEISAHSTTIISTANVLVAHPHKTQTRSETGKADHLHKIPVVAQYVFPTPGNYLLNCMIKINGTTKEAKAQKIIRIGPSF
mgnify:CR=1 FL=1